MKQDEKEEPLGATKESGHFITFVLANLLSGFIIIKREILEQKYRFSTLPQHLVASSSSSQALPAYQINRKAQLHRPSTRDIDLWERIQSQTPGHPEMPALDSAANALRATHSSSPWGSELH